MILNFIIEGLINPYLQKNFHGLTKNIKLRNRICAKLEKSIHYDLPQFMSNDKIHTVFKICPQCMKYGYQSYLHQIDGLNNCFLHKCSLISVPQEQVNASKDGTYKFMDIKVENLVHNKELLFMIQEFIARREEDGLLDAKCIFPQHGKWGAKICYESTERIFQKFCLLQDEVELYGCKCIQNLSIDDIDKENEKLKHEILVNYTNYYLQCYKFKKNTKNFKETMLYIEDLYLEKSNISHYMSENVLGWCFTKIMWDVIDKIFEGYNDWESTVWTVNSYHRNYMTNKEIDKYAVVLAYQAITATTAADNAVCYNSRYWYRNAYICDLGINVYEELSYYREPYELYGNYASRKATQYTIFPIVKDLFVDLTNQAYRMLQNGAIELDPEYINELKSNIWRVPQYVVLYYHDRTEIYRCEPD